MNQKILPSQLSQFCLTGADAGHFAVWSFEQHFGLATVDHVTVLSFFTLSYVTRSHQSLAIWIVTRRIVSPNWRQVAVETLDLNGG